MITGESIRNLRQSLDLSQREVSRCAEITQGYLSRVELGDFDHDPAQLLKIHKAVIVAASRKVAILSAILSSYAASKSRAVTA